MAWTVEYDPDAQEQLAKLDTPFARQIVDYMTAVARLDNPRVRGEVLTGNLAGLRRYRIGNWRVVCDLMDTELIVYAIDVGHRSQVYR